MTFNSIRQTICSLHYFILFSGCRWPWDSWYWSDSEASQRYPGKSWSDEARIEILGLSHGKALFAFIRNVQIPSCQQTASVITIINVNTRFLFLFCWIEQGLKCLTPVSHFFFQCFTDILIYKTDTQKTNRILELKETLRDERWPSLVLASQPQGILIVIGVGEGGLNIAPILHVKLLIFKWFLLFRNVQTRQDPKRLPNEIISFYRWGNWSHTYCKTTPIVELRYGVFPSGYNTGSLN